MISQNIDLSSWDILYMDKTVCSGLIPRQWRAWDKVWTTGVISVVIMAKIPPHLIHITYSYLQNQPSSLILGSFYSNQRPVYVGVHQGSSIRPTLLNICIDIPSTENHFNIVISISADDSNINVRSGSIGIGAKKLNNATCLLEQ
jgi:hypothetical protein